MTALEKAGRKGGQTPADDTALSEWVANDTAGSSRSKALTRTSFAYPFRTDDGRYPIDGRG